MWILATGPDRELDISPFFATESEADQFMDAVDAALDAYAGCEEFADAPESTGQEPS